MTQRPQNLALFHGDDVERTEIVQLEFRGGSPRPRLRSAHPRPLPETVLTRMTRIPSRVLTEESVSRLLRRTSFASAGALVFMCAALGVQGWLASRVSSDVPSAVPVAAAASADLAVPIAASALAPMCSNGTGPLTVAELHPDSPNFAQAAPEKKSKPLLAKKKTQGAVSSGPTLIWPVPSTRITSAFGYRQDPVDGTEERLHRGVDIATETGTPVLAAAAGKVLQTGVGRREGIFVRLRHSHRLDTLYAHLASVSVLVGQQVQAGQPIGSSGSTGRVTGPHLHLELLKNGTPKNPRMFHWTLARDMGEQLSRAVAQIRRTPHNQVAF